YRPAPLHGLAAPRLESVARLGHAQRVLGALSNAVFMAIWPSADRARSTGRCAARCGLLGLPRVPLGDVLLSARSRPVARRGLADRRFLCLPLQHVRGAELAGAD